MTRHPAVREPIKFFSGSDIKRKRYCCEPAVSISVTWEEPTQDDEMHCSAATSFYNTHLAAANRKFVFRKAFYMYKCWIVGMLYSASLRLCVSVSVSVCVYKNLEYKKARHVINADCPRSVMHEMSNPRSLSLFFFSLLLDVYVPSGCWGFRLGSPLPSYTTTTTTTTTRKEN
jgi:hypothetical protein